jgi:hypothetical protein
VTPAGRPAAFTTEGSPFARLEAEQAAAAESRSGSVAESFAPPAPIAGLEPLAAPPLTEPAENPPDVPQPADTEPGPAVRREPQRLVSSGSDPDEADRPSEEPGEVDRVMLAKEFSGLLQLNEDGDEDNS